MHLSVIENASARPLSAAAPQQMRWRPIARRRNVSAVMLSPLQRTISQLETIRMPGPIEAAALACFASEKEDSNTPDPTWRQRLANVGVAEAPKVDAPQTSAADALLSDQAFKDLVTRLDSRWTKRAAEFFDIYQ
jgi:hypothetical protein